MGLIKKSSELVISPTVKMMVYGQAGMGKTTLALSAPKPLLIDFDGGVKRVNNSHLDGVDIVQVSKWADVLNLYNEDLTPYETIVVDTIGKMMDFIIDYKCNGGMPTIKSWGGINQEFSCFIRTISSFGKNTIFVAHRDTRKEGDDTVFIPALREKSYNSIVTELDLLGYLEMKSDRGVQHRAITFDPTSRNDGKNTCNLPSTINLPTVLKDGEPTAANDFITRGVIMPYKAMIEAKKAKIEAYNSLMAEISEQIAMITDARDANDFASRINSFDHVGASIEKTRKIFADRVAKLKLEYDKTTKTYEDAV